MPLPALLFVLAVAVVTGGCGSDDAPTPVPPDRAEESADALPKLRRGFEEFVNRDAGVAFGRPPGWDATAMTAVTTLEAPDRLVAATITIDRTDDALGGDPKAFAVETAKLLPGYEKPLRPGRPKPFGEEYVGAIVDANGVAEKSGVRQRVRVVVLVRKGVAVVTAVIAANATKDSKAEEKQALEAIRTLRTRPPD